MNVPLFAMHHGHELLLQLPRDRASFAGADGDAVRAAAGGALRRCAGRAPAVSTGRIGPHGGRRLLRGAGIPFAETMSKPLVVVPVLRTENRTVLWEENNPWRAAWIKTASANGLVPLLVASTARQSGRPVRRPHAGVVGGRRAGG